MQTVGLTISGMARDPKVSTQKKLLAPSINMITSECSLLGIGAKVAKALDLF